MRAEEVRQLIEGGLPDSQAFVRGDDEVHFEAIVVSDGFAGQTLLAKQRMVYATLGERIADGTIHALSIKAYTPAQWRDTGSPQFD